MSVNAKDPTAEALATLPWSREIVADEDGVFIASVPELEGCFADGDSVLDALSSLEDVLLEWLRLALKSGVQIPEPRRQPEDIYSGRFSVRVPRSLHRELSLRADREGASLNQLVAVLLATVVRDETRPLEAAAPRSTATDAHEAIAADAVSSTHTSIGALKGIATFLRNRGDLNLACLLFAVAADRIAVSEGTQAASHELGVAAALARRNSRVRLAEALWRESLRRDPSNLRSNSALGQLLYHQGRYDEAVEYLEPASAVDNYALIFLGWSLLLQGRENRDERATQRGTLSITRALKQWSYQNREMSEREPWLRHIRRLARLGPTLLHEAEQLVEFANANSGWPAVDFTDIESGSDSIPLESFERAASE